MLNKEDNNQIESYPINNMNTNKQNITLYLLKGGIKKI